MFLPIALTALLAATAAPEGGPPSPQPQKTLTAPSPYSLPFGLRPALPVTVLRLDSVVALHRDKDGNLGVTTVVTPLAGYRFTPRFMGFLRIAVIGDQAPAGGGSPSLSNPMLGAIYSLQLPASLRLAFFFGSALPLGMGGDRTADPGSAAATQAGVLARSAMDNALFAVNDLVMIPGVDLAFLSHGVTVQVEATVLQLLRVRGEKVQPDAYRTNFTTGLHVGYFPIPQLSLGAELRYQRWLSTPAAVEADPLLRDNLSVAAGPRLHAHLPGGGWLRPGLSYAAGIYGAMADRSYHILQADLVYLF